MNIAIVGKWLAFDGSFGGIPIYNRACARGYAALGHSVTLIGVRWSGLQPAMSEAGPGIRILRVDPPKIPSRVMRSGLGKHARAFEAYGLSRKIYGLLRELIRTGNIDAAEFAESSLEGYHSVGKIPVPHFVRCHTPLKILRGYYPPEEFGYGSFAYNMERAVIEHAPSLTTPSDDLRERILMAFNCPPERVSVVPNPVEADLYRSPLSDPSGSMVLHVGRLDSRKGGSVLGKAIPKIVRNFPDAQFCFAGEDRLSAAGQGISASILDGLALEDRSKVHFAGYVDESSLIDLYGRSSVCAVPSNIYESFSYTAAQAMSCSRAVVASRIGGILEVVVDGETGLLIRPGDADELAEALVLLLKDTVRSREMGRAGRSRVEQLYRPEAVCLANLEIFQSLRAG